jgi:cytochrome c oxidase cbb3-type subunit 3/ubiquinol-cytochrome c reductase cytochrome c subunit
LIIAALLATAACGTRDLTPVIPPAKILNFASLYSQNCAGCHGESGGGGAAMGLGNPVYLAVADDATIARITSVGVPGTAMPPKAPAEC